LMLSHLHSPAQCPKTPAEVYKLEQGFERGDIDPILDLGMCISTLFEATRPQADPSLDLLTTTEKFMRLYMKAAITEGREQLAESTLELLLERFPRFELDPEQDPPQMVRYMDSLVAYPANHLGIFAGPSFCFVDIPDPAPLYYDLGANAQSGTVPNARHRSGYQFGAEWIHYFGYRHSFVAGLGVAHATHALTYQDIAVPGQNTAGDWEIIQREKTNFIQLPVQYQYRLRLDPHHRSHTSWLSVRAGFFGCLRLHSETELETTTWVKVGTGIDDRTQEATIGGMSHRRVRWATGAQLGFAYQMNLTGFAWYVRGFAQYGFTQMRKADSEYESTYQEYLWNYHLGDHNFRLHSVNLVLGVLVPHGNRVKNLHRQ
ncbi:MAG TPA: hypothetical protein VHS96_12735, partial [Bacteroidia bacterium]|nr:hypothetical protein [Bacteroidia bacterium]